MALSPAWISILDAAKRSKTLHLSGMGLTAIPAPVLQLTELVRLDLGGNELSSLPAALSGLTSLEELWLNDNPLTELPTELSNCHKLKVLDCRNTLLRTLPRELGRLPYLVEIDLRGIPALTSDILRASLRSTDAVLQVLQTQDKREQLRQKLDRALRDTVYREIADNKDDSEEITALVHQVVTVFQDFEELKSVIRNVERLFPPVLADADATQLRKEFIQLKRENQMKKLAAEVELKLRAIYFNNIRPESVEGIVQSIYTEITTLEDIKFLLHFATRLFPPKPENLTAKGLKQALLALRQQLAEEREAAIKGVESALRSLYPDQEPEKCRGLADDVAKFFKKVEDLKQLASDAKEYFPSEFSSAVPHRVHRAYTQAQADKAATAS